ncbi:hypothetical protein ACLPJK_26340 [Pseudomonas aeruginosa]|uniref:hypothetical protein n=1 Tax=Pseudomonas aeruginosa TaxID=287 RepID=UPI003D2B79F4
MTKDTTTKIAKEDVRSIECKHVTYVEAKDGSGDDYNIAKLVVHTHSGERIPVLKYFRNFERPFWLTKKVHQNHTGRKEWEDLDKLDMYKCRQNKLVETIALRQGWGDPRGMLRTLARNPYLYGADIKPETLIKAKYMSLYKDSFTPNQVAVVDFETDVLKGDGKAPIIGSITMKEKVWIGVMNHYVEGIANPRERIDQAMEKYLGDVIKERNIQYEVVFFDSAAELVYQLLQTAHRWKPDLVVYWNMLADLEFMIGALQKENYDLAQAFSDPTVPPHLRHFDLAIGKKIRVKADGKAMNLANYERWHTLTAPAHFVHVDAMAAYYWIRKAKGKEPSYALDDILTAHLDRGKLYIPGTSTAPPGSIDWHMDMQMNYKIPYIVYNVFDDVGVEMLLEKTLDMDQLSLLLGFSPISDFVSNPRHTSNKMFFHCLNMKKPRVLGCVSDRMTEDIDKHLPGRDGINVKQLTQSVIMW